MVGCETANHLAHHSKRPTIIEMLSDLAPEEPRDMKRFLMESLREREVPIHTDSEVVAIGDRIEIIPSHGCTTSNLYREYVLHRNGIVTDIWPIEGSGKLR